MVCEPAAGAVGSWRPVFGRLRVGKTPEELRTSVSGRVLAAIAFDGVGIGWPVISYYDATRDTMLGASPMLFVVEPSLLGLAVSMHLHDWRELIADRRVVWCVGGDAYDAFEAELIARPHVPLPQNVVVSPAWHVRVDKDVRSIVESVRLRVSNELAIIKDEVRASRTGRDVAWWAGRYREAMAAIEPNGRIGNCSTSRRAGRPFRVLARTSRFTTVLQYSTRDAMEALEGIGCETQTLIERDAHSYLAPSETLALIRDFDPDLIFMIDHTRRSQSGHLIEQVPVVTWIQDRLSWLYDEQSGRAMGPLDFCMGQGADELVGRYGYPADRFFSCGMATHTASLVPRADRPDPDGFDCDIAYATHASETPEAFHAAMRERVESAEVRQLFDAVYELIRARSNRGDLNGSLICESLVQRAMNAIGVAASPAMIDQIASEFARPLCDRFLRHETISWAADWAERTGGRLHLYGNGWEQHPRFARFAKGALSHGWELGAAFRRARVNLHAGNNCALHQRILDGLAAGGFFLIRKHGADVSQRVARAIYEHLKATGAALPSEVRAEDLPEDLRAEYVELRRYNGFDADEPSVQTHRHWEQYERLFVKGTVQLAGQVWPELDQVLFASADEFAERVDHFLARADERAAIAASMRKRAVERFGYESLMRELLLWMTDRLTEAARCEASTDIDEAIRKQCDVARCSEAGIRAAIASGV